MHRQQKAYLLALLAILFWSTAGSAFKLSLDYLGPAQLLLYAAFVSLLFLAGYKLRQGELISSFRITGREWLRSAIMGFLNPFGYYIILFEAYELLLAQEAVALNYIWPVVLVLLSIPVLKQKISLLSILALLISFAGMLMIILKGSLQDIEFSSPRGILFASASSILWASFWLINMKDKRAEAAKLLVNFVFGVFYILAYVLWTGTPLSFPQEGLFGGLYIGLFEMGITFVIWLKALKLSTTTAKISNLVYISPFLSLVFVSLTVGEMIYWYTIAGLALIVSGIVLQRIVK